MAEVKKNIITQGMSGKLGDTIVFRLVNGKTIVAAKPALSDKEPSDSQKSHRERFQEAVIYARHILQDAGLKSVYQEAASSKPGVSAYNIAVADFFGAPDIQEIDLSQYTGQAGDPIVVKVTDDFKVAKVRVEIYNPDGSLVEQGEAVKTTDGLRWLYSATAVNDTLDGDKILIKAYDIPGNQDVQEQSLG
ncbi:hypothetical protein [Gaoshiqia sp. Z1-71]|uniref:hypothetical protein n=1 Tax=Gaoshiqia hydrogeniformans TaxID=3290090 RepID=UPI003BF82511